MALPGKCIAPGAYVRNGEFQVITTASVLKKYEQRGKKPSPK